MEQLAAHLRGEIAADRLSGTMPGVIRLVKELGVRTKTVLGPVPGYRSTLHLPSSLPAVDEPEASRFFVTVR